MIIETERHQWELQYVIPSKVDSTKDLMVFKETKLGYKETFFRFDIENKEINEDGAGRHRRWTEEEMSRIRVVFEQPNQNKIDVFRRIRDMYPDLPQRKVVNIMDRLSYELGYEYKSATPNKKKKLKATNVKTGEITIYNTLEEAAKQLTVTKNTLLYYARAKTLICKRTSCTYEYIDE